MAHLARIWRAIDGHGWVVVVLLCFGTIAGSYAITVHERDVALNETCKFVDADHDSKRTDLVVDLKRIFRPPYRQTFPLSSRAAHKAYRDSKHRYDHVIDTRPAYCHPRPPIKPFPPYREINPQD